MKKIILSAAAVFAFGFANAQITTDAGTFSKPVAGDLIMEISFAPNISGGGIFSLPTLNSDMEIIGVKGRKFISESKAYRAVGNVSVSNSGQEDAETNFTVAAGFGVEHHRKGAERLSTYWGYEGNVGFQSGEETVVVIDPVFGEFETFGNVTKIGLGANLFTGFDYYIMPNVYLGVEVAYGVAITNTKPEDGDGVTKFELAPGITPFLRLGWKL